MTSAVWLCPFDEFLELLFVWFSFKPLFSCLVDLEKGLCFCWVESSSVKENFWRWI